MFDSVFWTPPPAASQPPVAKKEESDEDIPERNPDESSGDHDDSDWLLLALEDTESTPQEILARMDKTIEDSEEDIKIDDLIAYLYDKFKEYSANSLSKASETKLESGEFQGTWRKLTEIEKLIAGRETINS